MGALCSGHARRKICSALGRKASPKTSGLCIHLSPQIPDQGWPEYPLWSFLDRLWLGAGLVGRVWGLYLWLAKGVWLSGCLAMTSQWMQPLTIRATSRASLYSSCSLRRQPQGTAACPLGSDVGLTWVGSTARDSCLRHPCLPPAGVDPCVCPGPRSGALHPAGDLLVGAARLVSGTPGLSGH